MKTIELQKTKGIDYITFLVSMFFIAYYFLRRFGFFIDAISFIVPIIVALGYMLITMNWNKREMSVIIGMMALIMALVVVELFCTNDFTLQGFVSLFYYIFMDFFPLYLTYMILKSKNRRLLKWVAVATLLILAYVLILTLIEIRKDDRFMRDMSITYENYQQFNATNAGGYQFAYSMTVFSCFLIVLIVFLPIKLHRAWKCLIVIALILVEFLILNSSYTLALMISICIIFSCIVLKSKKTSNRVIFFLMGIIGFVLLLIGSDWIINALPTEEMRIRMGEVFSFLKGGDASGYNLNGRLTLYGRAILAFLDSPLLGNIKLSFDPHSSILRFFARDGILGGTAYVLLYYFGYRLIVQFIGKENKRLVMPTFLSLIFMGMVNPIHSVGAVHYIVFFIAPLMLALLNVNKKEEINETSLGD